MWRPVSKSTKTIYILYVEFVFKQTAYHAASRWHSWSETSLQSVVDVNFSEKWPRIRAQRIDVLATSLVTIDESFCDEIPNPAIPLFINWIAFDGVQECTGRHPLVTGLSVAVAD